MPSRRRDSIPALVDSMKRASAALRDAGVEHMLGGGLAAWARGGPPTDHDVDFFVRPQDAERGLEALVAAGMRPDRPPEDWLLKAWNGDVLVDLIFSPSGGAISDEHFARAEWLEVMAQRLLVASPLDIIGTKVLSLSEQEPDFGPVLEMARALREQIDWDALRAQTEHSAFARAFLTLCEGLGIANGAVSSELRAVGHAGA